MNQNSKNPKHPNPPHDHSLRSLLRRAAREAIGEASVQLEVDASSAPATAPAAIASGDAGRVFELVTAMVRASLDCLPTSGGEITITLWQTHEHCEIEVADNGPAVDQRPRRLPLAAASLGAELVWQNCPQGGAAVTARLRRPMVLRDAA